MSIYLIFLSVWLHISIYLSICLSKFCLFFIYLILYFLAFIFLGCCLLFFIYSVTNFDLFSFFSLFFYFFSPLNSSINFRRPKAAASIFRIPVDHVIRIILQIHLTLGFLSCGLRLLCFPAWTATNFYNVFLLLLSTRTHAIHTICNSSLFFLKINARKKAATSIPALQ